jgi:hypothetical protein
VFGCEGLINDTQAATRKIQCASMSGMENLFAGRVYKPADDF